MGVDIAMGLVVLVAAIRGYLRGFVLQAARVGAFVAAVYVAGPIRDQARPYVHPQFPSMSPELLDRLVWWSGAVVSYLTIFHLASWMYTASKKRPVGESEPARADQGAGFVLGAAKGVLVASTMAFALDQYALGHLKNIAWLEDQSRDSKALAWSRAYQPAQMVWQSPPVQAVVNRVRLDGLMTTPEAVEVLKTQAIGGTSVESPTPPTDRQAATTTDTPLKLPPAPPSLAIPNGARPGSPDFLKEFDKALEAEGITPPRSR